MDFLTFKRFISTEVLIVFYYAGALFLPVAIWFLMHWLIEKNQLFNSTYSKGKELLWNSLNSQQRSRFIFFFVLMFFFMELFWRMLFEFLIAYMQMRDALLHIQL